MLWIAIFGIIGLALTGVGIGMRVHSIWSDYEAPLVIGIVVLIIALIMCAIAGYGYAYKDVTIERAMIKHDALEMQLNNNYYNKFTYDGRQNLVDSAINFNRDVILYRAKHRSIWIGAFYPEDWDSVPLIDLGQ